MSFQRDRNLNLLSSRFVIVVKVYHPIITQFVVLSEEVNPHRELVTTWKAGELFTKKASIANPKRIHWPQAVIIFRYVEQFCFCFWINRLMDASRLLFFRLPLPVLGLAKLLESKISFRLFIHSSLSRSKKIQHLRTFIRTSPLTREEHVDNQMRHA